MTNEQGIVPTISGLDSDEKIDEDEGKVEIVLREPSACKAEDEIHRLLKMQCFDLDDVDYRYVRASVPSCKRTIDRNEFHEFHDFIST